MRNLTLGKRAVLLVFGAICARSLAGTAPAGAQEGGSLRAAFPPADAVWLDTLEISKIVQGWGSPHAGRSVDDNPLKLKGELYRHGIGTHARSEFVIDLKRAATRFVSMVGVDDERSRSGSVVFQVWVDGKMVQTTGIMRGGATPGHIEVDLKGAKRLTLIVEDGGDGNTDDHADWAGAMLFLAPGATDRPVAYAPPVTPPRLVMLTPDPKPAIHGPRIVGATPGKDFLYRIPTTGDGPLKFSAKNLPTGILIDPVQGVLRGTLGRPGVFLIDITVRGPHGSAKQSLTLIGGDHKLALTPPLGWNSWNVWAGEINAARVRAAADQMLNSGLAAHGFQYINIDDTWESKRDADGEILCNSKFPDMKALADYVHGQGLKIGIYSSPGPKTCGGYEASYKHELQDARTYSKWGFDYLKYDWCSYGDIAAHDRSPALERLEKPYRVMREALDRCDRDIVFSFCQYGMGNVWEWGTQLGGNCWRTTGDINDSWGSLFSIFTTQDGHEKFAGPGHWNDPDMLVVGRVGWGDPHPSRLTPNEQILHISMWCLLSSPLLIGCDMERLDPFTVALLSNDEALDINQDPLGKPAGRKVKGDNQQIWARPLFDGTTAVGLVNTGPEAQDIKVTWEQIGRTGPQPVRDLWLHKSEGTFPTGYSVSVPPHGCVLLKVGKPQKTDRALADIAADLAK